MFLEEGEDALEVLKEKPKKPTEKSVEAGTKTGPAKPAEVKGKVGGANAQPSAKKTAVLKESHANVIKPTEQNKPREGTHLNYNPFQTELCKHMSTRNRQRGHHVGGLQTKKGLIHFH